MSGEELGKTKRYDPKTRKAVRRRIKELVREGYKPEGVAEVLAAEGVLTPNGKTPDWQFVRNQMTKARILIRGGGKTVKRGPYKKREAPVAVTVKDPNRLPTSIELMLSDVELTAQQKINIVLAYQESLVGAKA